MARKKIQNCIGARLRLLMDERKITQPVLATATHLSQATISRYYNDETEPKVSDAHKLALYFGVSIEFFLTGQTNEHAKAPPAELAEWKHRALSAEDKLCGLKAAMSAWLKKI